MATTAASYRNPQPPQPRIREEEPEPSLTPGVSRPVDPGALLKLSEDLFALCEAGMLEAFVEDNIVRYRPTQGQRA